MKKRFIFEPADFNSGGQMVVRNYDSSENVSRRNLACAAYKIGWFPGGGAKVFAVALTDGMCQIFDTKEALCSFLNDDELGFRPMCRHERIGVADHVGNRFEKDEDKQTSAS